MSKDELKKIKQIEETKTAPRGEEACLPIQTVSVEDAVSREKAVEALQKMIQLKEMLPNERIVVRVKNGSLKCDIVKVREENGQQILEDKIELDDIKTIQRKRQLAKQISKKIQPELRNQISDVVFTALCRKPVDTLKNLWKKLRENPPVLRNRVGCIFLEVGDETIEI